jgi:hypothetical protein
MILKRRSTSPCSSRRSLRVAKTIGETFSRLLNHPSPAFDLNLASFFISRSTHLAHGTTGWVPVAGTTVAKRRSVVLFCAYKNISAWHQCSRNERSSPASQFLASGTITSTDLYSVADAWSALLVETIRMRVLINLSARCSSGVGPISTRRGYSGTEACPNSIPSYLYVEWDGLPTIISS